MDIRSRNEMIVNYLKQTSYADISTLSNMLGVSEMTVRRDLDNLEKQKILLRVHGGARLISQKMYEAPLDTRIKEQADEKFRIGRYAAGLVEEGDAIAIDDSSTTYAMVPYLDVNITVITNHISVATALIDNDKVKVVLLGGNFRKSSKSMSGPDMETMMNNYNVDKVFLSAKAVDVSHGPSDASFDEGVTKKAFMRMGKQVYFLFDHTKLETSAFYNICSMKEVQNIIVDHIETPTPKQQAFLTYCRDIRLNLHLAK